jgi:hypothetical protein
LPPEFFAPDLRGLFSTAREYLDGSINIQGLNGAAAQARQTAILGGASHEIVEFLDSWIAVINRRWNEWGTEMHPLSEGEFKVWLREQLLLDSEGSAG